MDTLWLKILIMPIVIAFVTVISRKFGNVIGGVIAGMPWVGGAILLFIAIEQGKDFAEASLPGVMVGLISWIAFCVSYMIAGQKFKALPSMLIGMAAFVGLGSVLRLTTGLLTAQLWFIILMLAIVISLKFFPKVKEGYVAKDKKIKMEIPLRMLMITAFVLALTYSAKILGPTWSGILTPFPIMTAVLAVFTHIGQGMQQVRLTLLGMYTGVVGFASFLLTLVYLMPSMSIASSFSIALMVNVLVAFTAKMLFGKMKLV